MAAAEEIVATATKAKTPVQKVRMSDGREVEFAGKRKMLKSTLINGGDVGVRLDFRNGETRSFICPSALILQAAGHGLEQKYGDETAGEEDVDDMVLAVDDLNETIQKGSWTRERAAGGFAGTSVLLRALVEYSGRTAEQVKDFLKGKSQVEKLALRNSKQVKPIVERIEAEKAAKAANVDTGALFAALNG